MAEEQEKKELTIWQKLAEPFNPEDLEWRVLQAKPKRSGELYVQVFAYVTARAIHDRLDSVLGPQNWCNTPQTVSTVDHTKNGAPILSVQVGISVRVDGEWITKYNVSEATDIEAVKGAYSGAEKRAGEEWGIGRYLWSLDRLYAEVTEADPRNPKVWTYGKTSPEFGNRDYWWKPPLLPTWAMPQEMRPPSEPVTKKELSDLKKLWCSKLGGSETNEAVLRDSFRKLLGNIFGEVPPNDPTKWNKSMISQVRKMIDSTPQGGGPSDEVPFG